MSIWDQLAASAPAQWVQLTPFVFALFESLHLVGVAFFFGSILLLDLRLIGVGPALSVRLAARHILPLTIAAFLLITATGGVLFISAADRYAASVSFQLKALLMVLGGINLALFHTGVWRRVETWGERPDTPALVKAFGMISILVWIGAIVAGRWMGYEPRPLPSGAGLEVLEAWL